MIGVEGARAIGDMLKTNSTLTELSIYITNLFKKKKVCLLCIASNAICAEGAKAICEGLKNNRAITGVYSCNK